MVKNIFKVGSTAEEWLEWVAGRGVIESNSKGSGLINALHDRS
jgi:hypothetical protein